MKLPHRLHLATIQCSSLCPGPLQTVEAAQTLDGTLMARFRALARDAQIWLSLGGFQEVGPDAQHIYNTHVILDSMGNLVSRYRKVRVPQAKFWGRSFSQVTAVSWLRVWLGT